MLTRRPESRGERQRRFLSGARIRVSACWNHPWDRPIVLSVYRGPRNRLTADYHSSFGVGAYPVQNSSRCLERGRWAVLFATARFGRRVSALPFVSAKAPSGLCTSNAWFPRRRARHSPRMLTPRVARAAHWRSLNRDLPTSDVLCHLAGTIR